MAINFKKVLSSKVIAKKINPIELYETLDRKSIAGPLRTVQSEILKEWYEQRKDAKDIIIKLHTGEGKTLIGLLILQSILNSGKSPCLYICPNKYLVEQVCDEAKKFGISYCCFEKGVNDIPNDFINGRKLLITHVQKLFNGLSVFGIGNNSLPIDTVLLDDSHTCIDTIKNAFTVIIERNKLESIYNQILELFSEDLSIQGEGSLLDICNGSYDTFMAIPYWSWNNKKSEILNILSKNVNEPSIKYVWPLLKDRIKNYCCYISGTKIEISPYNLNINEFGSFARANHRILMSATTQDDSFFIKWLNFNEEAIKKPLIAKNRMWSGEKMIIIPSLINENCDRELIQTYFVKNSSQKYGIIALVSNTKQASLYEKLGATLVNSSNIYNKIDELKQGRFKSLLVIINRYYGIDLPDDACRILIMDGLPYFDSLTDRYEFLANPNCATIKKKIAQKIEQGLGRGVRGEKDFCAIIIIGNELIKFIKSNTTNKYFSMQTRMQIEIGEQIAKLSKEELQLEFENSMDSIVSLIKQLLNRDEGWKEYYVNEMNSINNNEEQTINFESLQKEALIEEYCYNEEYEKAFKAMQELIDKCKFDDLERGWYLQKLARYKYELSVSEANKIQKSAHKLNKRLLKPKEGIDYQKISYIDENRLNNIKKYFSNYSDYKELSLNIQAITENLSFGVDPEKFESALNEIGKLLGFECQRPDDEIGKGPDNLWCGTNNHYLLFECKNQVKEERDFINKHETGQMNNHCGWFEEQYGKGTKADYFMIISTKELAYEANFTHKVRIIKKGKLKYLKDNINNFIKEFKLYNLNEITNETIQKMLDIHHLNEKDFSEFYSEDYFQKKA